MPSYIEILLIDIKVEKEKVFVFKRDDVALHRTIDKMAKTLVEERNFEIFYKDKNLLVCEEGYYLALWKNDPCIKNNELEITEEPNAIEE